VAEQFLHRGRVELVDAFEFLGMDAAGHEQAIDAEGMRAGEVGTDGIADRQHPVERSRVLAIGDSVRTDLAGADGFGIDLLFVTRGIHSEQFEGIDQLDPNSVKELFGHPPRALMRELKW